MNQYQGQRKIIRICGPSGNAKLSLAKKGMKYIMERNNEQTKDGVFFINDQSIINIDMFIRRIFEAFRINYVISDDKQEFN